jgi:hypothetical protein
MIVVVSLLLLLLLTIALSFEMSDDGVPRERVRLRIGNMHVITHHLDGDQTISHELVLILQTIVACSHKPRPRICRSKMSMLQ